MRLQGGLYVVTQVVGHGAQARSHLLPRFMIDVDGVFQAMGQSRHPHEHAKDDLRE